MLEPGTRLNLGNDMTDFENATFVRVTENYEAPESIGDLFDCEFIIDCDGERYRVEGWQAEYIEAA